MLPSAGLWLNASKSESTLAKITLSVHTLAESILTRCRVPARVKKRAGSACQQWTAWYYDIADDFTRFGGAVRSRAVLCCDLLRLSPVISHRRAPILQKKKGDLIFGYSRMSGCPFLCHFFEKPDNQPRAASSRNHRRLEAALLLCHFFEKPDNQTNWPTSLNYRAASSRNRRLEAALLLCQFFKTTDKGRPNPL